MSSALDRIERFIAERCAVPDRTPIVAACSGGADSTFLVDALARLSARWPLKRVLFVDHGLRPVDGEAAASRRAADRAGAPWERLTVALPKTGNLQGQAREARYGALLRATPEGAMLATGHTLDDQAETVVQRLIRGSGLRGLSGISPRDGRLVRPLLSTRRSETRELTLGYEEDPTNDTSAYQRNRLRHDVLPRLEQESPGAIVHLASLAERVGDELGLIDALLETLGAHELDLGGLPLEATAHIVRWRANRELPRDVRPREAALLQAAKLLVARAPGGATSLGQGWAARAERGRLSFVPENDSRESLVLASPGSYRLPRLVVELTPADRVQHGGVVEDTLTTWLRSEELRWPLRLTREAVRDGARRHWVLSDAPGERLWGSDDQGEAKDGDLRFRMIFSA